MDVKDISGEQGLSSREKQTIISPDEESAGYPFVMPAAKRRFAA